MQVIYRTHPGDGGKPRPEWFSKWSCLANLLRVFGREHPYHFIVDGGGMSYFAEVMRFAKDNYGVSPQMIYINEHQNARAFGRMLDYACSLRGVLYLVEDDFLHRPGAASVLLEGTERWDYVTGYDHPDKYTSSECVTTRPTKLYVGSACHWRETPSTTATFTVKAETLREDYDIWKRFSEDGCGWVRDREAFAEIEKNRTIVSTVPAYSTHCESKWLAPLVNWAEVNCQ